MPVSPDLQNVGNRGRGGVSPQQNAPAIVGGPGAVVPGAVGGGVAFPNFTYQGGPIVANPQVFVSFWGDLWSDATHQAQAQRLVQFHADLLQSGFMNVLSQYGVGNGAGNAGSVIGSAFLGSVSATMTNQDVQNTIQSAIDNGIVPEPTAPYNLCLFCYLDENTGIEDPGQGLVLCEPTNDTAFGYHEFFTTSAGNSMYYAIVPALGDTCLQESCPDDSTCSLHLAETQEQRRTQVASHEFAEMTTDPQLNGWLDPQNGENGDICNGESDTITVNGDTWTVQATYSQTDDNNSNGNTYCVSQAASPIPPLPGAP